MTRAADPTPLPLRLSKMIMSVWTPQIVYVATVLGLPDQLAAGKRRPEEIAAAVDAPPGNLRRVLRAMVALELCTEDEPSVFALTPMGELLRSDVPDTMRNWALLWGRPSIWAGWGKLLESVKTGKTAPMLLSGKGTFEWMQEDPDGLAIFNESMAEMTRRTANAVAATYDFNGVSTVVDVGGGHGQLLVPILQKYAEMKGRVLDLPYCEEGVARLADAAGLGARLEHVPGDFFESVPAGADRYLVKSVIHDWDDEKSLAILRNIRAAMGESSRLLLIEPHASEKIGTGPFDGILVASDINMLLMTGGCERTEREYRELLRMAGLEVTRVVPTPPAMPVIEARC